MTMKNLLLLLVCWLVNMPIVYAQKSISHYKVFLPEWSFSAKGGIAQFQGDLRDDYGYEGFGAVVRPSGVHTSIGIRRQFGEIGGITFNLSRASIRDSEHQWYNARFEATAWQMQLAGGIDIVNLCFRDIPDGRQRIFIEPTLGIGFTAFKSMAFDENTNKLVRQTDGFQWRRAYSMGIDGKYFITENQAVGIELMTHLVNTDILDATIGGAEGSVFVGTVKDTPNRKFETAKDHWGYLSLTFTQLIRTRTYRSPRRLN